MEVGWGQEFYNERREVKQQADAKAAHMHNLLRQRLATKIQSLVAGGSLSDDVALSLLNEFDSSAKVDV